MTELDCRHRAVRTQKIVDAAIRGKVLVVVNAGAVIRLFAAMLHSGFFAKNQPRAAHGKLTQMHQVIVVRPAIAFGGVLAHGRHHHTIAQGDRAECHGGEK